MLSVNTAEEPVFSAVPQNESGIRAVPYAAAE